MSNPYSNDENNNLFLNGVDKNLGFIYKLVQENNDREILVYITKFIFQVKLNIKTQDEFMEYLNDFYNKLNLTMVNYVVLVGILRTTSIYSSGIERFKDIYLYTVNILTKNNIDYKKELYGINKRMAKEGLNWFFSFF